MGFADPIRAENVVDADTYMSYVCQTVGSPWQLKDTYVMKKKVKDFFKVYPQCSYETLIRVAHWARSKKKRPPHAYYVVDMARYAWADGAVPEMDPSNVDLKLERLIRQALETETDPTWRERLVMSEGDGRRVVFDAWKTHSYG